MNFIIKR